MIMREEFIDKTDRRKTPKFSYVFERIYDYILDWYYHVETTKIAKLSIHDNKINYMYEPFPYRKLIHLFKYYPFEEKDVFIDIGCGKGQTLKCQMNSWNSLPHGARLRKRTVKTKHRAKRLHLSFWCKRDSWAA